MTEEELEEQRRIEESNAQLEEERRAKEEQERLDRERQEKEEEERYREERFQNEEHKCAYCTHLEPDKKNEGRYYCNFKETYVKGTDTNLNWGCRKFEDAGRSVKESDLILEDSTTLDNHQESVLGGRYCSDCIFLDDENKQSDGCYMCTKRNQAMFADTPECYMFEPGTRGSRESEKLYDEAKEARKKSELSSAGKDLGGLIVLAIILIIGAIIVNVFFN